MTQPSEVCMVSLRKMQSRATTYNTTSLTSGFSFTPSVVPPAPGDEKERTLGITLLIRDTKHGSLYKWDINLRWKRSRFRSRRRIQLVKRDQVLFSVGSFSFYTCRCKIKSRQNDFGLVAQLSQEWWHIDPKRRL